MWLLFFITVVALVSEGEDTLTSVLDKIMIVSSLIALLYKLHHETCKTRFSQMINMQQYTCIVVAGAQGRCQHSIALFFQPRRGSESLCIVFSSMGDGCLDCR